MAQSATEGSISPGDVLESERSRLVGLCAALTGRPDVAEDLAQESLYEAYRHWDDLHQPDHRARWLSGIARNVCRRWQQRRGWETAHQVSVWPDGQHALGDQVCTSCDDVDLERDMERRELTTLLDRAMALLPPETRTVLVDRFVHDMPHAEIALRLGVSEGTVKVRLHRGKAAMRRLLATRFEEEARSYGLLPSGVEAWEDTPLWCSFCGQRKLQGRLTRRTPQGDFALMCPYCFPRDGLIYHQSTTRLLGTVTRYRPALSRIMAWVDGHYRAALRTGITACHACGRPAALRMGLPGDMPGAVDRHGLHVRCPDCGDVNVQSLEGLVLALPEAQQFHRVYPRIRTLPLRQVEAGGVRALVTSFQSGTGSSRLDVVSARDTYAVLSIHGAPSPSAIDSST